MMDNPFDDLNSRIDAYRGATDDGPPTTWTPEHVMERLVEAFVVVAKTGGRVGPAAVGNGWPGMLREFHELIDADARAQMERDAEEESRRRGARPSALEIERADEALAWAARYLAAAPLQADALQLWAWCKAGDRDARRILRARALRADAMVARRQAAEDKTRKALRAEIAARAAAWANKRIVGARDAEHIKHIKHNARIRYERDVAARAEFVESILIKRKDVAPGKVFTRRWLDENRKLGAALIADALRKAGVIVR